MSLTQKNEHSPLTVFCFLSRSHHAAGNACNAFAHERFVASLHGNDLDDIKRVYHGGPELYAFF